MKPFFIFLACLFFMVSNAQSQMNIENLKVEVKFTNKMDWESLVHVKADLKKKNILLEFVELKFDENGKLFYIMIKVDCGDGFKGTAGSALNGTKPFGFKRDYEKGADSPFIIGVL
jgi:hypothetical protein